MHVFRSEAHVARWCARERIARGDVQPVGRVLELARRWHADRPLESWRPRSQAETEALFRDLGLPAPFWTLAS